MPKINAVKIIPDSRKNIYSLRLAITTECNLRCVYCFVRKTGKTMRYSTARKAVSFFLKSSGKQKLLIIYGGEPLLYFGLLRKIIFYARKIAKQQKKSLIISIGTNGTIIKQEQLDFFKKTQVRLAVSIDGEKRFHDASRIFPDKKGSFNQLLKNIPIIASAIEKENLSALFGVTPPAARFLCKNLLFLNALGFENVNIEPVQSVNCVWNSSQKRAFQSQLSRYLKYMHKNILKNAFYFLNTVNRELKDGLISRGLKNQLLCPFFWSLEIYPDGEMAFSPFLINEPENTPYLIGNVNHGLSARYNECEYRAQKTICQNCWNEYRGARWGASYAGDVVTVRDIFSIAFARMVKRKSERSKIFARYMREAKKRIFE